MMVRSVPIPLIAISIVVSIGVADSSPGILPEPPILSSPTTHFDPVRDGFGFANGLRWDYGIEAASPPEAEAGYDQRCFQMARAARQFFYQARFDAESPPPSAERSRKLVARVMASDPRSRARSPEPVVIPGHVDFASFSIANEPMLKDVLGGSWRSYRQRGNWRMIFGFTPGQERRTAAALLERLRVGHPPIVHVMRFPDVTVNHALLIHAAVETTTGIDFLVYDPNDPGGEVSLRWDRAEAHFELGRTAYWPGGVVNAYEIYSGPLD